jgi:hypothetical protein
MLGVRVLAVIAAAVAAAALSGRAESAIRVFPGCGATLKACVGAAHNGDTIRLKTSAKVPVPENFLITKGLSFVAAAGYQPRLVPKSPATAAYMSIEPSAASANVSIRGIRFNQVAVYIQFSSGSKNKGVFERNAMTFNSGNNGDTGVDISYDDTAKGAVSIRDNQVASVGSGIVARAQGGSTVITGNRVRSPADGLSETGIYFLGKGGVTTHALIASNVVRHVGDCGCGNPDGITVDAYGGTIDLDLLNNTIDDLGSSSSAVMLNVSGVPASAMNASVYNNLVTNAPSSAIILNDDPALTVVGDLNDVFSSGPNNFGSYDMGTTLNVDPMYVDSASGDLRLQAASPLVDAGDTCVGSTPLPRGDAAQRFRVTWPSVDIGAYERGSTVKAGVAGKNKSGDGADNTITGTTGRDVLCGLSGFDTITAKGGPDLVFGGDANDTIDLRDGVHGNDYGDGGFDTDSCLADTGDTLIGCP